MVARNLIADIAGFDPQVVVAACGSRFSETSQEQNS